MSSTDSGLARTVVTESAVQAVRHINDGATVLAGGFGDSGYPGALLAALADQGTRALTLVSNNAGRADNGIGQLIMRGQVAKLVTTYPVAPGQRSLQPYLIKNNVLVELVPQGTLAQRLHAGGFRLPGFLTRVAATGDFPEHPDSFEFEGERVRLERPIRGDVALLGATIADPWGNLRFTRVSRNFNPVMADAADLTIAQVTQLSPEPFDPDDVHISHMSVDVVVPAGEATA